MILCSKRILFCVCLQLPSTPGSLKRTTSPRDISSDSGVPDWLHECLDVQWLYRVPLFRVPSTGECRNIVRYRIYIEYIPLQLRMTQSRKLV